MSEKWIRDTGLTFALVALFFAGQGSRFFLLLAGMLLAALLIFPRLLYPLAFLWKKVADLIEWCLTPILFSIIFFFVVTPIGYMRRLFSGDLLFIKNWSTVASSFVNRNHLFKAVDLENPF